MNIVSFINITKGCNVSCDRCYLKTSSRSDFTTLGEQTLLSYLENPLLDCVAAPVLIWEGGEVVAGGVNRLASLIQCANSRRSNLKHRCVTNFMSLPDSLISLAHAEFESCLETTYANGGKRALSGDEALYQSQFKKGVQKAIRAGLNVTVNVEVNDHTVSRGVESFLDVMEGLDGAHWEFDYSCDFEAFLRSPKYKAYYPVVESTVTYKDFWDFIIDLKAGMERLGFDQGHGLYESEFHRNSTQFNVQAAERFFTLNPDGSLTTNPLYSDMEHTFLGNVNYDAWPALITSTPRLSLIGQEAIRASECIPCEYFSQCGGGASHVAVNDGSGACVGGYHFRKLYNEQFIRD